jgi:radical SAM protein with 4Fe4S-binding SPASM domain
MEKVFDYWAKHRDINVNTIDQTMEKLIQKKERRQLCQVGQMIVGITVDGDIYPCHDFAGRFASDPVERAKLVIGNVESGYSPNLRNFENGVAWQEAKSGNGHDCAACWAKWACGKGCPYMNYAHSGEMGLANATFCAATRINASLALRWMSVLDEFRFVDSGRPKRGQARAPVNGRAEELKTSRVPGRVIGPHLPAVAQAETLRVRVASGAD